MEIGNWKSVNGMAESYRQARELGIESNLAELEAFGFTVIPPDKTGAPPDFTGRMLERLNALAEAEDEQSIALNRVPDGKRPVYGRQIFRLLGRDPIFVDAVMNPAVLAMGRYLMGESCRLFSVVAFYKDGPARCTGLHSDSVGVPSPLPTYGTVCNISWVLTDYRLETGTLAIVPGSHRYCRHPTESEQPKFMGGPMDDDMVTPVRAEPGSIVIFTGNTWHGSYPKPGQDLRAHVSIGFCRNFVHPAESYADVDESVVEQGGPELGRLMGRTAWQGYGTEGPKLERMAQVRDANKSRFG